MSTQIGGLAGLAIMVITGSSWHHEPFKRASGWQELEAQQCPPDWELSLGVRRSSRGSQSLSFAADELSSCVSDVLRPTMEHALPPLLLCGAFAFNDQSFLGIC